jgi:hypothetical protein
MRTQAYFSLVLFAVMATACGGQVLNEEGQPPENVLYKDASICGGASTTIYCSCNPSGGIYDDAGACTGAPLSSAKAKTLLGTKAYTVLEGSGADHYFYCSRYRECTGASCGVWMNGTASSSTLITGKGTSYPLGDFSVEVDNHYQLQLSKPTSSYTVGWHSRGFTFPYALYVKVEAPLPSSTSLNRFNIITSGESGSSIADPGMSLEAYYTSNPSKITTAQGQVTDNCARMKLSQRYVDTWSSKTYEVEAVGLTAF